MSNKNTRSLSARKELDQNLFEKISDLVEADASEEAYKKLAKEFLLNDSTLYGTASFYDFTKFENSGKKIHVCNGSACLTSGKQQRLEKELKETFSASEIGHAACVGHCHTNGAFLYNNKTYSLTENVDLHHLLHEDVKSNNSFYTSSDHNPILTSKIDDLEAFYSLSNQYKTQSETVINELKTANLRGRGGAGFPFWFKLDAVSKEKSHQKYIVCNADEGDPGAYSDMYLLESQPHKVLFGMYMSALTVGADTGILYIRGEYPQAIQCMLNAIDVLKKQNLTPNFRWKIIKGQGAYVCGEETALLNSIEGLRPEVRVRPPYPAQYGLYGKPTVLSNVETFANVYWILAQGGNAFAAIGTAQSKGTKLVSLDGHFNRPGLYEISMGTPVSTVIKEYGLGFNKAIKAIQVGGPLGGIIPVHKLDELTLDFESFSKNGFLLGHASFVCIPVDFPMIEYLEHLLKFAADESCGKCFPCRIGTYRGYELLVKAQHESYKIDKNLIDDLLETLEKGSLCALGGGVPLPVRNALNYFESELKVYFQ